MPEPTPPDWYPDPFGRFERRYWDGSQWTEHVSNGDRQGVDQPVRQHPVWNPVAPSPGAGWYADPAGIGGQRYWDGERWTNEIAESVSVPSAASPPSVLPPPNRKVARLARQAGATAGQAGGGTLLSEQVLVFSQMGRVSSSAWKYAIYRQDGLQVGSIRELRRDLGDKIKARRGTADHPDCTHRYEVVDLDGQLMLKMARLEDGGIGAKGKVVVDGPHGPIGQICKETQGVGGQLLVVAQIGVALSPRIARKAVGGMKGIAAGMAASGVRPRALSAMEDLDKSGSVRFRLEADGRRLGSIHDKDLEERDFKVKDSDGRKVARITRTSAGWAKERFAKADHYVLVMHRPLEEPLRSLVIAAALAIDIDLNE